MRRIVTSLAALLVLAVSGCAPQVDTAAESAIAALQDKKPSGFEGLLIRSGDLGTVGTGFGFRSFDKSRLGIVARDEDFGSNQFSEGVLSVERPWNAHFGVFVRRNPSNGQRYNCVWGLPTNENPNGRFLLKLDGLRGAPTLGSKVAERLPVGGDKLRIEATVNLIRCLFNDQKILSAFDSTLSQGELGMVMTGARMGEFPVSSSEVPFPVFERWSGGNL